MGFRDSFRGLLYVLLALGGASAAGCSTHPSPSAPVGDWSALPPGEARALKRLEALSADDPSISYAATVRHADGRFGYVRGRRTVPGFLSEDLGIDATGLVHALADVDRTFAEEHVAQWGKIGRQTAEKVHAMRPTDAHTFLVWYEKDVLADGELERTARELDPSAEVHRRPNVIILRVTKQTLMERLSRAPFVRKIIDADPVVGRLEGVSYGFGIPVSDWIPSSALTSHSDELFFQNGLFATDVPVGHVELPGNYSNAPGSGCFLWHSHEAFAQAKIVYQNPNPLGCGSASDCEKICGTGTRCLAGVCTSDHATATASRIASNQAAPQPGPYHAGQAALFVANNLKSAKVPLGTTYGLKVTAQDVLAAYRWLDQNRVRIVSESYIVDEGFTFRSALTDWYARYREMTYVQAAGNKYSKSDPDEVGCASFGNVCVGDAYWPQRSGSDPSDTSKFYVHAGSRWANPYYSYGAEKLELEKPDVLAEGSFGTVALHGGQDQWGTSPSPSTSAATPVVAGLLALRSELCANSLAGSSPLSNRSWLRTIATWVPNQIETTLPSGAAPSCATMSPPPAYPAPHLGCDFWGGAGPINVSKSAASKENACDPPPGTTTDCGRPDQPPCSASGGGLAGPDSPWVPVPSWALAGPTPEDMDKASTKFPLRQTNFRWMPLFSFGKSAKGMRIRATVSYNSCPMGPKKAVQFGSFGINDLSPAVNFDVALCGLRTGATTPNCLFAAEALHETNEGFDVTLPDSYDWLTINLVAPKANWQCDDGEGNVTSNEPYFWRVAWSG